MSSKGSSSEGEWKSAQDSKTGRTYYYHTKTKATTWTKPLELASPEERREMIELKEKTMKFFKEMEDNIRNKIRKAQLQDEKDRENRLRRGHSNSIEDEEDGFYYLDEREGSYDLQDPKEGGIANRNVRFTHAHVQQSEGIGFNTSRSVNSLETLAIKRVTRGTSVSSGDGNTPRQRENSFDVGPRENSFDPKMTGRARKNSIGLGPPRRIRTISTMDDDILLTMRRGGVAVGNGNTSAAAKAAADKRAAYFNAPTSASSLAHDTFLSSAAQDKVKFGGGLNLMRETSKEIADRVSDRYPIAPAAVNSQYLVDHMNDEVVGSPKKTSSKQLKRRNSTGTIFLAHTMSNQDNNATIECVCVVIRAHMLDAAKENVVPLPEYDVFKDTAFLKKDASGKTPEANVPSLSTVKDFFQYLFSKSQLESDTIIMALIYCERLVKETRGKLCIRFDNWRSILFACLVMASKVWDDLSMWNVDFSQVYPSFDLRRVNTLELAMLDALKYVIRVSASEYAKYYFHLRSMMARLGLYEGEPNLIKPLDLAGARKLQLSTEKYLEECSANVETTRRRFYSVHETGITTSGQSAAHPKPHHHTTIGLEQLVGAEHMDADGQVHLSKKASFKGDSKKSPKKAVRSDFKDAK